MKHRLIIIFRTSITFLVLTVFLLSCSNGRNEKENRFLKETGLQGCTDINESVELDFFIPSGKDVEQGEIIDLSVELPQRILPIYIKDEYFTFYTYIEKTWKKINNDEDTVLRFHIIEARENQKSYPLSASGIPDLSGLKTPIIVRGVFIANKAINGEPTKDCIGAFKDITVYPSKP
ncbi:MAG: hypothetical protein VB100_09085 [Angelakisella sp.]|nr:hypothetical protein [Angelakisella sp.]